MFFANLFWSRKLQELTQRSETTAQERLHTPLVLQDNTVQQTEDSITCLIDCSLTASAFQPFLLLVLTLLPRPGVLLSQL